MVFPVENNLQLNKTTQTSIRKKLGQGYSKRVKDCNLGSAINLYH